MVKRITRKKQTKRKSIDIKTRLIRANKAFGGNLVHKGNFDFEIDAASRKNKAFQKAAHLTRAMTSSHSFSDGNKRTATVAAAYVMREAGVKANKKKLVKTIIRLSKSGEGDLKKIERSLRRCTKK